MKRRRWPPGQVGEEAEGRKGESRSSVHLWGAYVLLRATSSTLPVLLARNLILKLVFPCTGIFPWELDKSHNMADEWNSRVPLVGAQGCWHDWGCESRKILRKLLSKSALIKSSATAFYTQITTMPANLFLTFLYEHRKLWRWESSQMWQIGHQAQGQRPVFQASIQHTRDEYQTSEHLISCLIKCRGGMEEINSITPETLFSEVQI